jgi:uncharacterized protein (DUF1697 family)
MAEFRALLSDLKYTNVATLLNSGNAVFHASKGTPAKHAADIAAAIIEESPITTEDLDHSRFLVIFTQGPRK